VDALGLPFNPVTKKFMKSIFAPLRAILTVLATVTLTSLASAHDAVADMTRAAQHWLAALDPAQAKQVSFPLEAPERTDWHFVPKDRPGLAFKDMNPAQGHLAYGLLGSALSHDGLAKATTVMSLEQILRDLENDPAKRDAGKYWFCLFGTPSENGTWGWRCEGHHCSVNFTIVNGRIAGTPFFLGANPGDVGTGPRQGLRTLAEEEDLARAFATSLRPEQREKAFLAEIPKLLETSAPTSVDPSAPAVSLSSGELDVSQTRDFHALIQLYLNRLRPDLAQEEWAEIEKNDLAKLTFVWAGSLQPREAHYYRIEGPTFQIEYINAQNQANHPHAVWRKYKGDFGRDWLKEHLQKFPH
jgi:hypothetical protein